MAATFKKISSTWDNSISFDQLYSSLKRATPYVLMAYKHSLLRYNIFNDQLYVKDWLSLNFRQTFDARDQTPREVDMSKLKIGKKYPH